MFSNLGRTTSALVRCSSTLFANLSKRRMAIVTAKPQQLWPFGHIPYHLVGFNPEEQRVVEAAIARFNRPDVNVTFERCGNIPGCHYVSIWKARVSGRGDFNNDDIGRKVPPKTQKLYCNVERPDFGKGYVMQRLMNLLGFYPEYVRPDRDEHIKILGSSGDSYPKVVTEGTIVLSPYDEHSIMHGPVLNLGQHTVDGKPVKTMIVDPNYFQRRQDNDLSKWDIRAINSLYSPLPNITAEESALLGRVWSVSEKGVSTTWVRRGNTCLFDMKDAEYDGSGREGVLLIRINPQTRGVEVKRRTNDYRTEQVSTPGVQTSVIRGKRRVNYTPSFRVRRIVQGVKQDIYHGIFDPHAQTVSGTFQGSRGIVPWDATVQTTLEHEANSQPRIRSTMSLSK